MKIKFKDKKMQNSLDEKDFYNTLWNYFSLHANQRVQVFNFFIIIECFLIGGFFTVSQLASENKFYKIVICCLVVLFSFIFFLLDIRTKNIIKIVEKSIIQVEEKYKDKIGKENMIFSCEQEFTKLDRTKSLFKKLLSYSNIFLIIFFLFIVLGIICIILTVFPNIFKILR